MDGPNNGEGAEYIGWGVVDAGDGRYEFAITNLDNGTILFQSQMGFPEPWIAKRACIAFMSKLEADNPGVIVSSVQDVLLQVPMRSVEYFH